MKFSIAICCLFIINIGRSSCVVEFSADIKTDGLEGVILFIKKNDQDPVIIKSNLHGKQLPPTGLKWEIRKKPTMHYYGSNDGYCNQLVANSELYVDFTATNDLLRSRGVYINEKLVVNYCNESILGYSVVLRDGDYPIACATILPANQKHEEIIVHRVRFNQMIGGEIYFVKTNYSTLVMGHVYGVDKNLYDMKLNWKLVYIRNSKPVGSEDDEGVTPNRNCSSHNNSNCYIGELGVLSEFLVAKKADNGWASMHHFRYMFPYMDLEELGNKGLAIKLEPQLKNVSVSISYPLFPLHPVGISQFKAQLYSSNESSSNAAEAVNVYFSQPSPYHTTVVVAKIDINIPFMKESKKYPTFNIYNAGSTLGNCAIPQDYLTNYTNGRAPYDLLGETSYETLPPLKNFTDSTMRLEYPVFVSLYGSRSILESILVIDFNSETSKTKNLLCGPIKPASSDQVIHLSAKFSNETAIFGSVDMIQYILQKSKTDPVIWINLKHESGKKSIGHMIHLHEYVPDAINSDPHWRCSVTGSHFNPTSIQKDEEYTKLCSENTAFKCEVGDLSGKFGSYNFGFGEMKLVDPTLDLRGYISPNGRSVIVHGPNGEKEFIGCQAILASSPQN